MRNLLLKFSNLNVTDIKCQKEKTIKLTEVCQKQSQRYLCVKIEDTFLPTKYMLGQYPLY